MVPINWLAVIVASLVAFGIGWVWFSDMGFGKPWRKLMGVKDSSIKPGSDFMFKMLVLGLGSTVLMAFVLAHAQEFAMTYLNETGLTLGLMTGFWNWLGFMVPLFVSSFLYEQRPLKLVVINSGYWLTSMLVMGVIIALWR